MRRKKHQLVSFLRGSSLNVFQVLLTMLLFTKLWANNAHIKKICFVLSVVLFHLLGRGGFILEVCFTVTGLILNWQDIDN